MIFQYENSFFLVLTIYLNILCCWTLELNSRLNNTLFSYHDVSECKKNEYYDLNYFACDSCSTSEEVEILQTNADKFSCACALSDTIAALYDSMQIHPICKDICYVFVDDSSDKEKCQNVTTNVNTGYNGASCKFKYINSTISNKPFIHSGFTKQTFITTHNIYNGNNGSCSNCDLKYNFQYLDYCIANILLKPYLKYNSFWQSTSINRHFGNLKFVAFFCIALHNNTSCNQLANLCVLSHFSFDKNSPCSAFLLTQASDVAIRYASMDDHLQAIKPFLFYKKGKQTAKLLSKPIENSFGYSLKAERYNRLELFSTVYAVDGSLQRWGHFKLSHVNLCQMYSLNYDEELGTQQEIIFAQKREASECVLTLKNLIDLAEIHANKNFMSLFLNTTIEKNGNKIYMQTLPILIEDLTTDNKRPQQEEWQLVKRFQLIQVQPRHFFVVYKPKYEDEYKLMGYRSISYVEKFEIHYEIHDKNRISLPIVKLRYRRIELSSNLSLDTTYKFKLQVTFVRVGEVTRRQVLLESTLPVLLLIAVSVALLRTYNFRKRHATISMEDSCDFTTCFIEFFLHLISNVANVFLLYFQLFTIIYSLEFLTQHTVKITLPIAKDHSSLEIIIHSALVLKLIFLGIHFWRISHFDLFLIDWERPKSYDNNHFNTKSNLETSSVCSSVRTFVSENNVSAWRILFTANEWIRLSTKQKTSIVVQSFLVLVIVKLLDKYNINKNDITIKLFVISTSFTIIYMIQLVCVILLINRFLGNPLQKFIDLCSLANVSVLTLLESSYGFYIHGRSPYGFSDTDMYSMIMQLQRESQNMCGRRGLLCDSDQQAYIIMPPTNLRTYFEKLLIPLQRSCSISQTHFQKEANSLEGNLERTSVAYNGVNRFFCAFIDHAIKDMDYIIKEKTFFENICSYEFDNYLTENKGTFYVDNAYSFGNLLLYGNDLHIFVVHLLLLLSLYMLTMNLIVSAAVCCLFHKLFQYIFRNWVRQNVATKTLIDRRFLM